MEHGSQEGGRTLTSSSGIAFLFGFQRDALRGGKTGGPHTAYNMRTEIYGFRSGPWTPAMARCSAPRMARRQVLSIQVP